MIITDLDQISADYLQLRHDDSFPFPDVCNPLFVRKRLAISDGKIIGAGLLKLTTEAILIMDKDTDLQTRAIAAKSLIDELKDTLGQFRLDDCHAFVKNPEIIWFLQKLGFDVSQSGTALVLLRS